MYFSKSALIITSLVTILASLPAQVQAGVTYITNFTKDNNIYTDLNQQFPNTGVGTPGSGVGVPNATFLYNPATYTSPNFVPGSDLATNNPTTFMLASNAAGQDFMQLSTSQFQPPTPTLVVPINLTGVTTMYTLTSAYFGQAFTVTFTGTGGATETFSNINNPDFNGGAGSTGINQSFAVNGSLTDNLFNQTALIVHNVGGGGTGNSSTGDNNFYDLTQQTYILGPQFVGQELLSATFTTSGNTTLLLGITALTSAATVPEPSTLCLCSMAGVCGLVYRRLAKRKVARTAASRSR
jgi:hypothetical protein